MPRRKTAPPRGILKAAPVDGERMQHARYHCSPDLEPYIEHFWAIRWQLEGFPPYRAETLPHPSMHLIFQPGVGGRIAGVARGKFSTVLEGDGSIFAAKFRPGGFYPFVRAPIAGFTDSVVTPASVWGADAERLVRAVLDLDDDDAKIQEVEEFLRGRRPEPDSNATLVATIVYGIAADRTILTVDDVAARFFLNRRKLQRLFVQYVGVNPKWVIQRYRLHEAAEQLAQGPANQVTLALQLGYADQAHFVKDFKATVGTSPGAYAKRVGGIERNPKVPSP